MVGKIAAGINQQTARLCRMEALMNKNPGITEQTKANLAEAFCSLCARKRIDQITVKEVAAKAGYNRATFYEYFGGIRQCLEYIEEEALPDLGELPPMPDGRTRGPEVFESFVELYRDKFRYYDALLGERGDPSFQRKLVDSVKAAILGPAGLPPGIDPMEADYMLEYVLSGMVGVMRHFFHQHPDGSQAEIMALLHRSMSGDFLGRLRQAIG
jgi:AcrR family transcriptional regulator